MGKNCWAGTKSFFRAWGGTAFPSADPQVSESTLSSGKRWWSSLAILPDPKPVTSRKGCSMVCPGGGYRALALDELHHLGISWCHAFQASQWLQFNQLKIRCGSAHLSFLSGHGKNCLVATSWQSTLLWLVRSRIRVSSCMANDKAFGHKWAGAELLTCRSKHRSLQTCSVAQEVDGCVPHPMRGVLTFPGVLKCRRDSATHEPCPLEAQIDSGTASFS